MTATDQVRRLLSLVPYLQRHPGVRVEQVTEVFGITEKQLLSDLTVLHWCGLPGLGYGDFIEIDLEAVKGEGVIHLTNADYLTRPLRLTGDEAAALIVAVRTLGEVAGPAERPAIDSVLTKLAVSAGEQARAAAQADIQVGSSGEDIRGAVETALAEHRQLHLVYDVASRAETTRRDVDPLRLRLTDGYVYLDAWCHLSRGLRHFRLDRIAAAQVLDRPAESHGVELSDPEAGWFDSFADAPIVTLDLAAPAQWAAEYYPTQGEAEPRPDGSLRVRFPIGDPAWLRTLLLRLGGEAHVVDDEAGHPAAAASAVAAAQEALAQYAALYPSPASAGGD